MSMNESQAEVLRTLTNIRSLRALLRLATPDQLSDIEQKFLTTMDEVGKEREEELKKEEERKAAVASFLKQMEDAGIRPEELLSQTVTEKAPRSQRAPRAPRPAKYKYMEDGQEKTWTGQGRMPKAIAEQVSAGATLESFLINPDDNAGDNDADAE